MDMRTGSIGKLPQAGETPLVATKRPRETKGEGLAAVRVPREEARRKDAREQDRLPGYGQSCRVRYREHDHEVEIVNLSGGGAMIACNLRPNIAERLDLNLGDGGTLECAVRWVKGDRIGLEFAHETRLDCSDDERAAVLLEVIERAFAKAKSAPSTDEDSSSEQRIAKRHPLIWSAELQSRAGRSRVRLRNVSATGALIQCSKTLPLGTEVILDLGKGGSVDGTISWAVGDCAGIRFDEEFDMRRLSRSKPAVAPARWLQPAYLKNEAADESAFADDWSRLSVEELKAELEGFLKR
jgi:hypothetical protein